MLPHITLPNTPLFQAAQEVATRLHAAHHTAYFAGGCVRDLLLGRTPCDIDIATSALPDQIEALFSGHTVAVGKAFGIIVVLHGGFSFDVATFRSDGAYIDGRHPTLVEPTTPEGDAQRRDFTINALFYDCSTGALIDFVDGLTDLTARRIRAIGSATARFNEDHLRMLRAIRFAATLEFSITPATLTAVTAGAHLIRRVSAERTAAELTRLLCEAPKPSIGLELLRTTGLLQHTLPEVARLYGTRQPPQYHPEGDVWTHTYLMLDSSPPPRSPLLAWSLLLHDIGKPATFSELPDPSTGTPRIRFASHAHIGAAIAKEILQRLRQPAELFEAVTEVVANHMTFVTAQEMRRAKLRRFMGQAIFPTLLEVMRLDTLHSNGDFTTWNFLNSAYHSFQAEPILPEPLVQGRHLIAWGICAPGPQIGQILRTLYDAQLEGTITNLEEARAWLQNDRRTD